MRRYWNVEVIGALTRRLKIRQKYGSLEYSVYSNTILKI